MSQDYGFSFVEENAGGLGSILHAMMLAKHHSLCVPDTDFVLVAEGREIPRFNGGVADDTLVDRHWEDYFSPIQYINVDDCVAVWKNMIPKSGGFNTSPPKGGGKIAWYSGVLKSIYILQPDVEKQLETIMASSVFNPQTDYAVHIRRTDKKNESGVISTDVYMEEVYRHMCANGVESKRLYLLTDDFSEVRESVCNYMSDKGVEVVWDVGDDVPIKHHDRLHGLLTKQQAWDETMHCLKMFYIMERCIHLVGGRTSYFYRIGELLRYPLASSNLKDNDLFGRAQYAGDDEPFVRPMQIHTSTRPSPSQALIHGDNNSYRGLVSMDIYKRGLAKEWKGDLDNYKIVVIKDFLTKSGGDMLHSEIQSSPFWWLHSVRPVNTHSHTMEMYLQRDLESRSGEKYDRYLSAVQVANKTADAGLFAYHFQRTVGGHVNGCNCFECRMRTTVICTEFVGALSAITGKRITDMGETFCSKYERDQFLTMHHDKDKGDYTFILSLSRDWNPVHGGLTHFYNAKEGDIYKTVPPTYGALVVFKLDPEHGLDHFVSRVNGDGSRIAYTGWFKTEEGSNITVNVG
jgi:hypothetical protein